MSAQRSDMGDLDRLTFELLRCGYYYDDRARHYDRVQRSIMFLVVILGTSSVATALGNLPEGVLVGVAVLTTVVGLVDLVFDVSGKARTYTSLKREVYVMLSEVEVGAGLKRIRGRLATAYGDEPAFNGTANALAYNNAMLALGRSTLDLFRISWLRRFCRHWLWDGSKLRTYRELGKEPLRNGSVRLK